MVEVRTASGLVSCTPYLRASGGLSECAPQFRASSGLVDCGNASTVIALTASPTEVYGAISRNRPSSVSTNSTTVSVAGGKAPYSYAWGAQPSWQVSSPTGPVTGFSTTVAPDDAAFATFICTVTDARGATATVSVNATASNYYQGGNGGIIQ